MKIRSPILRLPALPVRRLAWLSMAALVMAQSAHATDALEQIRQHGKLVVGVDYVVPAYSAGGKYRTPENFDADAAEALAKLLDVSVSTLRVTPQNRARLLTYGKVDVLLLRISDAEAASLRRTATLVSTGYQAQPRLIMRSDTDIKQWPQLRGRNVCVSEGSPYAGSMHALYGAREKVVKAPADALLALRVGSCAAAVHDDAVLDAMLELPEWKKFSASLPLTGATTRLVFALRPADGGLRRAVSGLMREWNVNGYWPAARKKWVSAVAFEVYLDQNVPDCH